MIMTRLRQLSLLVLVLLTGFLGFFQMLERTTNGFPTKYAILIGAVSLLSLAVWALIMRFQPHASQTILPCVLLLNSVGTVLIVSIDQSKNTPSSAGVRQLLWQIVALVLFAFVIIFLQDYRVLRRFSYVSMVVGLALLLSPMLPFIGASINGARVWIQIPFTNSTIQPGEFAKLFLAFFFAAYLFDHRDQLAVGGRASRTLGRSSSCGSRRWACWSCSAIWARRSCSSRCSSRCCTWPPAARAGS